MRKNWTVLLKLVSLLPLFMGRPLSSRSQDKPPLNCADVKNGTFYFFSVNTGERQTVFRKGNTQREYSPLRKENIFFEVNWLNDCTYTLTYQSGAEDGPPEELKILKKHIFITEIQTVTENYVISKTKLDKPTNPVILNDTFWIKDRKSATGKAVDNSAGADSISAMKKRASDSLDAHSATLYVYRPGKTFNSMMNYDLLLDGKPLCVISNGCREIVKIRKAGTFTLSAKVYGPEQSVTIDVQPGKIYYLQCQITWGLQSHPILTVMDAKAGAEGFNTPEKAGLLHKE
jgi:hypothetical protein